MKTAEENKTRGVREILMPRQQQKKINNIFQKKGQGQYHKMLCNLSLSVPQNYFEGITLKIWI